MKLTKIPGLGRFGVFIDDVDLNTISDDEWMEIGKIHLESLVTIIRGNDIDYHRYYELISKWGPPRYNRPIEFYEKYGKPVKELVKNREMDPEDMETFANGRRWQIDKRYPGMIRVTPKKNKRGESLGIFGDGELHWHSNECGDLAFTPGVALMGWENMIGSRTGFCTSVDWYESQTESFRSELDDMIAIHQYQQRKLNPDIDPEQENFYKNNTCPKDASRIPLVMRSPGGIKGIHWGINTIWGIEGMSKQESDALLEKFRKEMIVPEYTYHHSYKTDKDLLLFDNSITVHNRTLEKANAPDRVGLRIQYDYTNIEPDPWVPYYQDEFNVIRYQRLQTLEKAMEGINIKG